MQGVQDNRRYPRIEHVSSQQILRLDNFQVPHRNYIITKNMSACGLRFTTNEQLEPASHFLIYLNDQIIRELSPDSHKWFKLGAYYFSRVVWIHELRPGHYEVGAGFLERESCDAGDIDRFTELVNLDTLESLPEYVTQ